MATALSDILAYLDDLSPFDSAFEWDRVGLQISGTTNEIARAVVGLDVTQTMLDQDPFQLVISHHPLIWDALKTLVNPLVLSAVRSGASFVAYHTNWDAAPRGISEALASAVGLEATRPFSVAAQCNQYKLVAFVPESHLEPVLNAAEEAGAGVIGKYSGCSFITAGTGRFTPGQGANPHLGVVGRAEEVQEMRVEWVVDASRLSAVLKALHANHPYEEPATDIYPLQPRSAHPIGRIGELKIPMKLSEFAANVEQKLGQKPLMGGDSNRIVKTIAVAGGAASELWQDAVASGADVYVSGEFKHADLVAASAAGLATCEAGHYATEIIGMKALCEILSREFPDTDWLMHEEPMGAGGRSW